MALALALPAVMQLAAFPSMPVAILVVLGILALLEIGLDIFALVDLYRRPIGRVALGNKWVWVAIILLVNLVGAILYLAIGRKPAIESDRAAAPSANRMEQVVDSLYGPRDDSARS